MLFGGPKGCGKTSLARITAMAIVCDALENGEPCGKCASCQSVVLETSTSMDEFDAATQGTVDRIRSILEDLEYGSFDGKPRVVILDEAQRLSKAAQDALLKAIEDRRFVVILCTTEPHKIGEAIRSRMEEYPVSPPAEAEMIQHLTQVCAQMRIPYETDAIQMVARHNKCCPRTCLTSLDTLRTLGGVIGANARELFRYNSMGLLVDVLSRIDADPAAAFEILDKLFAQEGASWVRDQMVAAIASSLRVGVGAKPTYPVYSSFFDIRGMRWGDLARALGALDKPTAQDVEAAVLSTGRAQPVHVQPLPPLPPPPAPTPALTLQAPATVQAVSKAPEPPPKPIAKPVPSPVPLSVHKSIEVDGVKFTHDEKLTSLDHKIEPGGHPPPVAAPPSAEVELDGSRIPLPEKEFARGLVQRFQKGSS
jgi:DNA polymerase III subunit gamma/tau